MVVLRFMRRDFMATKTKMRRNTFYPHMRSDSHEQKRKMQMTLLFQVRGDVIAITKKKKKKKTEVVDVVAEEVITIRTNR